MFLQQSVAIGRPVSAALDTFQRHVVRALPALVSSVEWASRSADPRQGDSSTAVVVGPPRYRADACLYAVAWPSNPVNGRPEVDLDIEIAPLDDAASRLQFAGQLRLPWVQRWSDEERSAERRCTVAMASLLDAIARSIVAESPAIFD
jgi:hypothetical protein